MTEHSPLEFYQNQISKHQNQLKAIKQKLFWFGMLRLFIFLALVGGVFLLRNNVNIAVFTAIGGLAFFLWVISKNTDIRLEKRRLEKLIELNQIELKIANRDYAGLDSGSDLVGEMHYFNQDIDLFGEGAIFQLINRTETGQGRAMIAEILNANEIDGIVEKQNAIRELKQRAEWRQKYQTIAALIQSTVSNETIVSWLGKYKRGIPQIFGWFPLLFSSLSVLCIVAYGMGFIHFGLLVLWLFVGIGITGIYFRKVSALYASASQMTDTFAQYAKLLNEIENQTFEAELLKNQQGVIQTTDQRASQILASLSSALNSLDQRNNFLFAFVANGFFLWDLRYAFRIEQWIKKYQPITEHWFQTIAFFDVYNSLGNYAFNHPNHIFPTLTTSPNITVKATALGHPLLREEQRVTNDFTISKEDFFIITGANMAGKSTFLRTVALNLVLANVGLPVCAAAYEFRPIKLISSMRTSDSLLNDESYFFSELKRLKFIVEELKKSEYFIILDEILKGTNSKDKEEGSKKFVERLVSTGSTGIIATHDLSLCALSETLPQIRNHYFDAEIVNDELYFDYRFKDGICQNMNASFLLRKMEIV